MLLYISDPPFSCQHTQIGDEVPYNSLYQEPIDGFLRNNDQCIIILPPILKQNGEYLIKAFVLGKDYELV